jgi:hypothetical protein
VTEFDDMVDSPSEETPLAHLGEDNVDFDEYTTQGKTTVATRRGYRFVPSDKDLPVITHAGVKVTSDQATQLIDESDGLVRKVDPDNEEGE